MAEDRTTVTIDDGSGHQVDRRNLRTAAWGGLIGTALEQYDFVIYGTATAIIFNRIFFPDADPAARRHRRLRDLRGRVPGPAAGRAVLLPLRGPPRAQVRARRDPVPDGHLDVPDRSPAQLRAGRCARAGAAGGVAAAAGVRRRGRAGRRGGAAHRGRPARARAAATRRWCSWAPPRAPRSARWCGSWPSCCPTSSCWPGAGGGLLLQRARDRGRVRPAPAAA